MKQGHVLAIAVVCLLLGFSLGLSAKDSPAGGIGLFRGKPPKEAAQAALLALTLLPAGLAVSHASAARKASSMQLESLPMAMLRAAETNCWNMLRLLSPLMAVFISAIACALV